LTGPARIHGVCSLQRLPTNGARHTRHLGDPHDLGNAVLGVVFLMVVENVCPPIPSEVIRPLAPFLLFTTIGAGLWTALLASAGYGLGANFRQAEAYFDPSSYVVLAEAELRPVVKAGNRLMLFFPILEPYKIVSKKVPS
jgi:hypothetical protein